MALLNSYFENLESGGAISIEDDAAFDYSAAFELRFDLYTADWHNVTEGDQYIYSRWDFSNNDRVLQAHFNDTAAEIVYSIAAADGTFRANLVQAITLTDGQRYQFRVRGNGNDGGNTTINTQIRTGANLKDLESDDDWTNVGTVQSTGTQTWKAVNDGIWLLASWGNAANNFVGRCYRVIGWSDLTKSTKFIDWQPQDPSTRTDDETPDNSEFDDGASSNTWDAIGVEDTDWQYVLAGHGPNSTAEVSSNASVGGTVTITVQAVDYDENTVTFGGDTVVVNVSGANTATPTVTDNSDGTYSASYSPGNAGSDSVAITLNGKAISGSPKTVIVGNVGILHSAQGVGLGLNLGLGI